MIAIYRALNSTHKLDCGSREIMRIQTLTFTFILQTKYETRQNPPTPPKLDIECNLIWADPQKITQRLTQTAPYSHESRLICIVQIQTPKGKTYESELVQPESDIATKQTCFPAQKPRMRPVNCHNYCRIYLEAHSPVSPKPPKSTLPRRAKVRAPELNHDLR
jgi:hypothetical protein